MESGSAEQPDEIEEIEVIDIRPNAKHAMSKAKSNYITGRYDIEPTVSMVAEKKGRYNAKAGTRSKQCDMDLSGVSEGTAVCHKVFGTGTITSMDKAKKHIHVEFEVGEKNFIFPDAFIKGFLQIK